MVDLKPLPDKKRGNLSSLCGSILCIEEVITAFYSLQVRDHARICSGPLWKGYEEGNVTERDEGWKINTRKRKEEPEQICQRFPGTKVEKDLRRIRKGCIFPFDNKHLNRQLTEKDNIFQIHPYYARDEAPNK